MDVLYYHSNNKIRLNLREIEDLDLKPRLYQDFEKLMIINWMEICWGNFPYGMREVNKSWARSLLTWSCPSNWTEKPFLEVNSECLGLILCGTIFKKNFRLCVQTCVFLLFWEEGLYGLRTEVPGGQAGNMNKCLRSDAFFTADRLCLHITYLGMPFALTKKMIFTIYLKMWSHFGLSDIFPHLLET